MNRYLKRIQILSVMAILLCMLFACRKKYPYYFPDGTPGHGADSSSISVDTAMSKVDRSKYAAARVFPGLVGETVPRVEDYKITLDLDYHYIGRTLRISVPPQPQFSTGLYAPPGELIKIIVPEGLRNLSVQIGAWTDNLSNVINPKRDPVIHSRKKLHPGTNYVRNLYGGPIYILSPRPVSYPVDLVFTGPVKEPDFILGETDPATWWEHLQKYDVPWLELRSPNFVAVVPRSKFLREGLSDPTQAVEFWNNAVLEDYYEWMGLEANASDPLDQAPYLPFRAVLDIDISVGYGHSGFPVMFVDDMYWFNSVANYKAIKDLDSWGTFHEFGHNCQQTGMWSWSTLGETTNNLFIFKAAHRIAMERGLPDTHFFPELHGNFAKAPLDFVKAGAPGGFDGTNENIDDPFFRIIPFLQIFKKAKDSTGGGDGFDFMPFLYSRARHAEIPSFNDLDKHDFVYRALCDYSHQDWQLFFGAWGIRISNQAKETIAEKQYPLMTQKIWNYDPMTDTGGTGFFDPYKRSYWSVDKFSTQELSGEGANNGHAYNAFDNDINTFWHSSWLNPGGGELTHDGQPTPQWFSVDFGRRLAVKAFHFYQRQNNSSVRIKDLGIEVSDDGETWTSLGTYVLENTTAEQTITLPTPQTFRYFKITAYTSYGGTFAAMAEVWVEAP